MAADTISFRGTTLLDSATTGVGWQFRAGSIAGERIVAPAAQGIGYWLKPGNAIPAEHELDLAWATTTPATLKATVEALADATAGDLVLPLWGTLANCVLEQPQGWLIEPSDAGIYLLSVTIQVTQYPTGA